MDNNIKINHIRAYLLRNMRKHEGVNDNLAAYYHTALVCFESIQEYN